MEQKIEYYTPTIEELFIGYELEMPIPGEYKDFVGWSKKTVDCIDGEDIRVNFPFQISRVPYLCKQDIIDLGWEHKQYIKDSQLVFNFVKGEWYLEYWVGKTPYVEIGREGYDVGYSGNCKSKNELFKLMKAYLNIPI